MLIVIVVVVLALVASFLLSVAVGSILAGCDEPPVPDTLDWDSLPWDDERDDVSVPR